MGSPDIFFIIIWHERRISGDMHIPMHYSPSCSRVNFQEQYGVPSFVPGGQDRHSVLTRASMVRAKTGNSTNPTDRQGNSGIPFRSRAAWTRQVFVVTTRVFLSGRRISVSLTWEKRRLVKAIAVHPVLPDQEG
jgi:hypothetical protein